MAVSVVAPLSGCAFAPPVQQQEPGLPDTKVGTFTRALYEEAKKNG